MTRDAILINYFNWLYNKVCIVSSYQKLFSYLYDTTFVYTLIMDENRFADGINLRYRFADELGYSREQIALYLNDKPCSILEMMIALSIRCEEQITGDMEEGDRPDRWFWLMINNLGLTNMTDDYFDLNYVDHRIDIFEQRKYDYDGRNGALFVVNNPRNDMRRTDIWYQLCWYLNENR